MTSGDDPADVFLSRLELVTRRLEDLAGTPPPAGLTDPDQPTGERWDWGQVWAHLSEFIPYWMGQARLVLAAQVSDPAAFGRTKSDPERIAAIERDRHRSPVELWERLRGQLGALRSMIEGTRPESWSASGVHPTLGQMDLRRFVEEFLVGHLEQHVAQLDGLAGTRSEG